MTQPDPADLIAWTRSVQLQLRLALLLLLLGWLAGYSILLWAGSVGLLWGYVRVLRHFRRSSI
jgi:hypothetical protein